MTNESSVVMAWFRKAGDAEKAARELRQAGFAQIGLAARDRRRAEKIAGKAEVQSGVAVSPDTGGELDQAMGESIYSSPEEARGALQAAHLTPAEVDYFGQQLQGDGVLLSVVAPSGKADDARRILESHDGEFGPERSGEPAPAAEPQAVTPAAAMESARTAEPSAPGGETIRLQGEFLRIHKERVQRGEVRLRKEVATETQRMDVPVRHDELVVERVAPSGEATPATPLGSGEEVRVPLSEERVTVEKTPAVTEEVRVGTRQVETNEPVSEQVRREELRVEEKGKLTPEEEEKLRKERRAA